MDDLFETTKLELMHKAEIFKKHAEKYSGKLIYTLTSVAACENYVDEETNGDEEKYVDTIEPYEGKRCFPDFSSAFDAYIKCLESIARRFGYWGWYYQSNGKYDVENLDSLFSCSHDELEEKTAKKLSNFGKSESGSFAICDFHAKSDSDVNSETCLRDLFARVSYKHVAGITCHITLYVTDVKKAEEEAKAAEEDGRSFTEILESNKDYNNFSQETKNNFHYVCLYAEKFEKLLANVQKILPFDVLFVRNSVNVSSFEEAGHPYITPSGIARPLFTNFRAAFIDLLRDIFSSGRPVGFCFQATGVFDDMVCDILNSSSDGCLSFKDGYAYITENISEENINKFLQYIPIRYGFGGARGIFTYSCGDGIDELQIFRNLSVVII